MSSKMKNLIVLAVGAFSVLLIQLAGRKGGGNGESNRLLVAIGSACFILALVLEHLLFRCPHCGQYLGRKFVPGGYCPHCGKELD